LPGELDAVEAGHDPKHVRKFTGKRNALRHSFISHRLAVLFEEAKTRPEHLELYNRHGFLVVEIEE
jgi:hypothetical protein